MNDILSLYSGTPLATRAFLRGRVFLSDLEFIERQVPLQGTVLDLGCGHGLFANLLAARSPQRRVIGIDIDPEKIEIARKTIGSRANIEFVCASLDDAAIPQCDAITIVDVLYLLPAAEQQRLLRECHGKLVPGGLLVCKAQERRPRWKYAWTYFQELMATSAGLTRGKLGRMAFMSREESLHALAEAGFEPKIVEMKSWRPYSDILFLGN